MIAANLTAALDLRTWGVRKLSEEVLQAVELDGEDPPRGYSYGAIRAYRDGKTKKPRTPALRLIARVLDVRPEWLIWNEGEMTEADERVRAAAERRFPPSEDPGFWMTKIDVVFPEFDCLPPDSKHLVMTAVLRYMRGLPKDIQSKGLTAELNEALNVFLVTMAEFLCGPLYAWYGKVDPSQAKVADYLRGAVHAFLLSMPEGPIEELPAITRRGPNGQVDLWHWRFSQVSEKPTEKGDQEHEV